MLLPSKLRNTGVIQLYTRNRLCHPLQMPVNTPLLLLASSYLVSYAPTPRATDWKTLSQHMQMICEAESRKLSGLNPYVCYVEVLCCHSCTKDPNQKSSTMTQTAYFSSALQNITKKKKKKYHVNML